MVYGVKTKQIHDQVLIAFFSQENLNSRTPHPQEHVRLSIPPHMQIAAHDGPQKLTLDTQLCSKCVTHFKQLPPLLLNLSKFKT